MEREGEERRENEADGGDDEGDAVAPDAPR